MLAILAWSQQASADPFRVHVSAGAAHAVGKPQGSEFGAGGAGSATVELSLARTIGVQASGGGFVLSSSSSSETGVASHSTGTAFLGTVGVRVRPFGASHEGGLWLDANGGFAQTGSFARPAFDGHVGWDFRASDESKWGLGPFVGYTQIVQPDDSFRPDDARVLVAGVSLSFGSAAARKAAPPAAEPTPPPVAARDGVVEAKDECPDPNTLPPGTQVPEGCEGPAVKLVGDRLEIDDVILFEFDSPRIRVESRPLVKRIAQFIWNHSEIIEVVVAGHADAVGTDAYNQKLSEQRAESTRAMLIHFGVDASRLQAVGYGKSRLKFDTQGADARNRRVEFIVSGTTTPAAAGHRSKP
ncbi:Major porin and structural outer membrane porin OprF [Labilithrix luteola]|uniref:Major porin and structural outer membrane porin OprF n=1 Tax=Labilithrix luteola TaxID=1391654 RepID=A0A0K1PNB6_9BACT|nr:Major porin and structural outer membrane porin OprF [Labilithrix luteola]